IDPTYAIGTGAAVVAPGATFNVPVLVTDNAVGVASGKISFGYDNARLTLVNVTQGDLTGGWALAPTINDTAGTAEIAFATGGGGAISGTAPVIGSVLNLQFTVKSAASSGNANV